MINYNAYSEMLAIQVDMCFPFEIGLYRDIATNSMRSIVEVGCGNGYFLKILNKYFPYPQYCGYDHSPELIEISRSESSQIKFQIGSINSLTSKCDLLILRLIMHQLEDRKGFIAKISENLADGGQVIIIDAHDEFFQLTPELPAFSNHLARHREILSPNTATRNIKEIILKEMTEKGFKIDKQIYYFVPSLLMHGKRR